MRILIIVTEITISAQVGPFNVLPRTNNPNWVDDLERLRRLGHDCATFGRYIFDGPLRKVRRIEKGRWRRCWKYTFEMVA
jgi:hypothetical protein